MKLQFDPSLEYQRHAINAVVDVFTGQPIAQSSFEISTQSSSGMAFSDLGVGNNITLSDEAILANVQKIQEQNNIEKISALQGREFSTEMETGTGKTYVYLRCLFELSKHYGLKKFVIVVPSIAIREGVLKSIKMMKDHFLALYDHMPFDYFVYDSKKLGRVRQFANSNQMQIMVINIQSFQKDVADKNIADMSDDEQKKLNIINRENDKMSGRKPIEFIQATNPIIIIDEPQSVDNTPKAKNAIQNLNPAATLRYSATHRNLYNLLYKLDPVQAYDLRLVKRIEVASIRSDDSFNDAYVKLLKTDNKKGIKAQVEIHQERNGTVKPVKLWVKQGHDLFIQSGQRQSYKDGYLVQNIDSTPGAEYIELSNGTRLEPGGEIGGLGDEIRRAQVREAVKQHLEKERALGDKGIKVLSLFFIDKVANYRLYHDDGTSTLGKIGQWFEEAYKELTAKPAYKKLATADIGKIHNGYFSQDKQGRVKDTSGKTADDEDTYNLIMRDKERLLNPAEPLRFIFSHSALREGWDNPNVFQICTLNESPSAEKKRQEIGRGLRLPVDKDGQRIHDESINRLTVIANESYEDFAQSLQKEFEEECGITFGHIKKITFAKIVPSKDNSKAIGQEASAAIWEDLKTAGYINEAGKILDKFDPDNPHFELKISKQYSDIKKQITDEIKRFIFKGRVVNARKRRHVKFNKELHPNDDFKALWEKIKQRTRYRVTFDTAEVINRAVARIQASEAIKPIHITMTRGGIDHSEAGLSTERKLQQSSREANGVTMLPDLLDYLQEKTELTRHALVEILKRSGRLEEFQINPQQFMTLTAREISRALHDLMLKGITYEKIADHFWEMKRIEEQDGIISYLDNLEKVENAEKCPFDWVKCDSEVEKQFARDLNNSQYVRLFVKLPGWFKIDTPIGPYNPDWAFVTQRDEHNDEKLYFVRETKSTLDNQNLRITEDQKTDCGRRHFKAIDVDYDVVTKLAEVDF